MAFRAFSLMESLIVYAPNVGGGGGLVLLRELLRASWGETRLTAILDRRGRAQLEGNVAHHAVHWVDSSVSGRWSAERLLSKLATVKETVLCFHNLPPVLPNTAEIYCYVHNAYLVGLIPVPRGFGWLRIRNSVERFIARRFRGRVHGYLVQTPTMAEALSRWFGEGVPPIKVVPFTAKAVATNRKLCAGTPPKWDFLYPSDGPIHKNHRRLLDAWRLLAERGSFPTLAITLHPDRDAALRDHVRRLVESYRLRIEDLGFIPHAQLLESYCKAGALIFPSYAESFGLPLLEAQSVGLPILAPELDYVRDVCDPSITFDPYSARSIARAVQRSMGQASDKIEPMSADEFVSTLREGAAGGKARLRL